MGDNLRRIGLSILTYALFLSAYAGLPPWVYTMPVPGNNTYDYKVTQGEAKTYDEAYSKALARALLETSWKVSGVTVKVNDDLGKIEQDITQSLETISKEVRLQINKVCEYSDRPQGSMQVRVYILWQVPKDGYTVPVFESYNCY